MPKVLRLDADDYLWFGRERNYPRSIAEGHAIPVGEISLACRETGIVWRVSFWHSGVEVEGGRGTWH